MNYFLKIIKNLFIEICFWYKNALIGKQHLTKKTYLIYSLIIC